MLARVITPALVAIEAAGLSARAHEIDRYDLPLEAVTSAVAYQPPNPPRGRIFPKDSLIVTSFFGGGLYVLSERRAGCRRCVGGQPVPIAGHLRPSPCEWAPARASPSTSQG